MSSFSSESNSADPSQNSLAGEAEIEAVAEAPETQAILGRAQELRQQARGGSNWFYWIAGLSLVNSVVILLAGDDTYFVIGLGLTLIADTIAREVANQNVDIAQIVKAVVFGFDLIVALVIVAFGWVAGRGYRVVFGVGMFLYLLDGLLFVLAQDWFSVAFHAFALLCMWNGFRAYGQLNAVERVLHDYRSAESAASA